MRKITRVRLVPRVGKPPIFDQPLLPRRRELVRVIFDDLGNPALFYLVGPDDKDTELAHFKLAELNEVFDATRYHPIHVFREEEMGHSPQPKRCWVLLENNHPRLGP